MGRWLWGVAGGAWTLLPPLFFPFSWLFSLRDPREQRWIPPWWLGLGALLWILPGLRSSVGSSVADLLNVLFLAFTFDGMRAARRASSPIDRCFLGRGIVAGLFMASVAGIVQLVLTGAARASGWASHPNLWAVLPIAFLVWLLSLPVSALLLGAGSSAAVILVAASGSRSAAVGLAVVLVGGLALLVREGRFRAALTFASPLLFVAVAVPWLGETQSLVRFLASTRLFSEAHSPNLLVLSEALDRRPWTPDGVDVLALLSNDREGENRRFRIVKQDPGGYSRVHQRYPLQPDTTYTLQGEFLVDVSETTPGFVMWGRRESAPAVVLAAPLGSGADEVVTSPTVEVVATRTEEVGGWRRFRVTFTYHGSEPTVVRLGPAPALGRGRLDASVVVRRIQLEEGPDASRYEPTDRIDRTADLALSSARARIDYLQGALDGFLTSPWLGVAVPFADYYAASLPAGANPEDIPTHAHNFFVHVAYERGLLGLAGLVLMLGGSLRRVPGRFALLLVAGTVTANFTDATLASGFLAYPLIATLGWLSPGPRSETVMDGGSAVGPNSDQSP